MTAPCKECPNRKLGCHEVCEKYKAYKDELAKIRLAKQIEAKTTTYCIQSHRRYKHG